MNVLCLDQFVNPGGGQRSLLDLLPAFAARGWRPSVVVPGDGPFPEMVRKLGFHTHNLSNGEYVNGNKPILQLLEYAARLPRLSLRLRTLIRSSGVDVLYVNGARLLPPAALAARLTGAPLVFHCHNRLGQRASISLAGRSLQLARAQVIACCEHAAAPLRPFVNQQRLAVVYNGVERVRKADRCRSGDLRRIGVIGRIEPEKGQLEFIQAARLVAVEFPYCRFSIAGAPMFSDDSYYRQVVRASAGLPVEFLGWQDNISGVLARLDLLVVPSAPVEATTRVILEAYSAGVPVVAFPSGGIPEILHDNDTGFLASQGTPLALFRRIKSVLLADRRLIAAVVKRAEEFWFENLRLDIYRQKVCEIIAGSVRDSPGSCPESA